MTHIDPQTARSSPPKVLLVSFTAFSGGGEVYLERLAGLLRPYAELFCICAAPELKTAMESHCKTVYSLNQVPIFGKFQKYLVTLLMLPWLVVRNNIRVVQLNGPSEATFAPLLHLLGRRVVLTRHINLSDEVSPIKQAFYRWNARNADVVVCVSQSVRDQHLPFLPNEKLTVITNWVPSIPDLVSRDFRLKRRMIFVGRLLVRKGLHLLLKAMHAMPGWELLVVGEGPDRAFFEEQAKGLAVTFLGFDPDPSRHYPDADFLVHPSLGPEGCSLVPIEAMVYGLPCILSDLPSSRDVADDGRGAILFPVGDYQGLLAAMQQLAGNTSLRSELASHGHAFVQRRHSEDAVRPAYLRAFSLHTPESRAR